MQSVRSLISWHSQPETFAKDRRVVWAGFCPSAPFLLRCQNSFHFSVALYTPTTRWRCEGVAHDWTGQLFDSLLANYSDHSIRNIDWFSIDREQTILEGLSTFLTAVLLYLIGYEMFCIGYTIHIIICHDCKHFAWKHEVLIKTLMAV